MEKNTHGNQKPLAVENKYIWQTRKDIRINKLSEYYSKLYYTKNKQKLQIEP